MSFRTTQLVLFAFLLTLGPIGSPAQVIVPKLPPGPGDFTNRNLGESGGGGSSVGVSPGGVNTGKTVVVEYIAVTAVEPWTNKDGKVMEARLLAFSARKAGESGPVEIMREGKVRFLVSGRKTPVDYPLDQLGEEAQAKIRRIAEAAAKGPPAAPAG